MNRTNRVTNLITFGLAAVLLAVAFWDHGNPILLSAGLVLMGLGSILRYFLQPPGQKQESLVFAGLTIIALTILPFVIGFLRGRGILG